MMLETKVIVEVEVSLTDELAADWQESVKAVFSGLDGATVHFSESAGTMTITNIKVEK